MSQCLTNRDIDEKIREEIGEETDNLSWLFEKGRPKYRLVMELPVEYRRMVFGMMGISDFKKEFLRLYKKAMGLKMKISTYCDDNKHHRSGVVCRLLADLSGLTLSALRTRLFRK